MIFFIGNFYSDDPFMCLNYTGENIVKLWQVFHVKFARDNDINN